MKKASESPELTTARTSGIESLLETASSAIFQILPQPHSENFNFYSITSHKVAKLYIHLSERDPFTAHRLSGHYRAHGIRMGRPSARGSADLRGCVVGIDAHPHRLRV